MASQNIPVFSYNSFFVEMGATLSISADLPTTGRQAALIVRNIIKQSVKQGKSVQFPAGSSISLNLKTVRTYKMILNESALDSVNEIVDE